MAAPRTGFEDTGTWTTLDHETTFLRAVAANTRATLTVAGTSSSGRTIHRIDLGAGQDNTALIVALQHGNEPASREAVLSLIRDLAYSTDPAVTAYLTSHRLVFIPNANPDGFVAGVRETATGANTNRDFFRLHEPETRAVMAAFAATRPHLIVDAHEYFTQGENWLGRGNGLPGTHTGVQALGDALYERVAADLVADGFTAGRYWSTSLPTASLGTVAGALHSVGLLSETNATYDTPEVRVATQRRVLDAALAWHEVNADALRDAQESSRQWAATTTEPYPFVTAEFIGGAPVEQLTMDGYTLVDAVPYLHRAVFLANSSAGFAPMGQPARLAIPMLLDADSPHRVARAYRGRVPALEPGRRIAQLRIGVEGGSRPVTDIRFRTGGQTRSLVLPA